MKISSSKEYIICHSRQFLENGFEFHLYVCNGCHDVLMIFINLSSIATLNIFVADYLCVILGISKMKAINLLKNAEISEKVAHYKK